MVKLSVDNSPLAYSPGFSQPFYRARYTAGNLRFQPVSDAAQSVSDAAQPHSEAAQSVSDAAQPLSEALSVCLRSGSACPCAPKGLTVSLTVQRYKEQAAFANKTAKNTLFRPLFSTLFFAQKSTPSTKRTFGLRTSDVLVIFIFHGLSTNII